VGRLLYLDVNSLPVGYINYWLTLRSLHFLSFVLTDSFAGFRIPMAERSGTLTFIVFSESDIMK